VQKDVVSAIPVPASVIHVKEEKTELPAKRKRKNSGTSLEDEDTLSIGMPSAKLPKLGDISPSTGSSFHFNSDEDESQDGMLTIGGGNGVTNEMNAIKDVQDELMPLALVSLIPQEPDLRPTFSVYHLLYQQPVSDAYGRIAHSVIENISPMVMEEFIIRSGKW
jgi:hypothetical protein